MPPKIKIVDVIENDAYTITNDEVKESELPVENEPPETTEETTAIIPEKIEGTPEEISKDTPVAVPTKKLENSN